MPLPLVEVPPDGAVGSGVVPPQNQVRPPRAAAAAAIPPHGPRERAPLDPLGVLSGALGGARRVGIDRAVEVGVAFLGWEVGDAAVVAVQVHRHQGHARGILDAFRIEEGLGFVEQIRTEGGVGRAGCGSVPR